MVSRLLDCFRPAVCVCVLIEILCLLASLFVRMNSIVDNYITQTDIVCQVDLTITHTQANQISLDSIVWLSSVSMNRV